MRSQILNGRLPAGTLLTEAKVAQLVGTSATPVRQALRILLHEGLLEAGPRRQLVVKGFPPEHRTELVEVREALERIALQHACERMSPDELDGLHILLLRQKRAAEAEDDERFIELDEEFHLTIAAAAGLLIVPKVLRELGGFVRLMRLGSRRSRGHLIQVLHEHEALIEALESRDSRAAEKALQVHLHTSDYDIGPAQLPLDGNQADGHSQLTSVLSADVVGAEERGN